RESNTYYFFSIITDNVNIICIRKEKYTSGIIVILNILLINYLQGSVYVRANPNKDIPKGCVSRSIWQSQQEKQQDSSKLRSIKVPKPVGFVRPICEPEINNNNVQSENQSQNIVKQVAQNEVTNTIKNRIKALESKLPSNETVSVV
ncbi:unnamed protein product, partial [Schistosoma curassoni]|uniref:Uncharacterized protein n=1 Tax=Schistosoma curassoni TaxID=6186 RepID=A0A183JN39_9TREM